MPTKPSINEDPAIDLPSTKATDSAWKAVYGRNLEDLRLAMDDKPDFARVRRHGPRDPSHTLLSYTVFDQWIPGVETILKAGYLQREEEGSQGCALGHASYMGWVPMTKLLLQHRPAQALIGHALCQCIGKLEHQRNHEILAMLMKKARMTNDPAARWGHTFCLVMEAEHDHGKSIDLLGMMENNGLGIGDLNPLQQREFWEYTELNRVPGHNSEVLRGLMLEKLDPKVVLDCCENEDLLAYAREAILLRNTPPSLAKSRARPRL